MKVARCNVEMFPDQQLFRPLNVRVVYFFAPKLFLSIHAFPELLYKMSITRTEELH
jgi:hypothetical protein